MTWCARYEFLKCNGCETATYRRTSWFSEDEPRGKPAVTLYPPRGSKPPSRQPKQFDQFPCSDPVESVYRQTVEALNQGLFTLAGAGLRLIIEGVCNQKGIKDGPVTDEEGTTKRKDNLQGRIHGLAEKHFITDQQADILHQIRFLGNDATHELHHPSAKAVNTALDIVEHLVEQVYEQPEKAKALAARKRPTLPGHS